MSFHGENLRKIIRLSKMFCKSRCNWNMPGGLIQSVLCSEKIQSYDRLDKVLYYTLEEIRLRLEYNTEVYNPTDTSLSLLLNETHKTKMENLKNRLDTFINKLSPLFKDNCTEKEAYNAWHEFFNHSYWDYSSEFRKSVVENSLLSKSASFYTELYGNDIEEYIQNMVPLKELYPIEIDCIITESDQANTTHLLSSLNSSGTPVPLNSKMHFYLSRKKVPAPYEVYWKVKNNGSEAVKQELERGEIIKMVEAPFDEMDEYSSFAGDHYVECYIVKNGVCVAKNRIEVPIR